LLELFTVDETNSVVVFVEEGVVLSHEGVSQNEVVESSGEILSHDGHNTFSVSALSYLQSVIIGGHVVLNVINVESNIGESIET